VKKFDLFTVILPSKMGVSENSVPLNPMVLLIIIPIFNGYLFGNIPYFQTNPNSFCSSEFGIYINDHTVINPWIFGDPNFRPQKWSMLCQGLPPQIITKMIQTLWF
jgi:hypothetical protein